MKCQSKVHTIIWLFQVQIDGNYWVILRRLASTEAEFEFDSANAIPKWTGHTSCLSWYRSHFPWKSWRSKSQYLIPLNWPSTHRCSVLTSGSYAVWLFDLEDISWHSLGHCSNVPSTPWTTWDIMAEIVSNWLKCTKCLCILPTIPIRHFFLLLNITWGRKKWNWTQFSGVVLVLQVWRWKGSNSSGAGGYNSWVYWVQEGRADTCTHAVSSKNWSSAKKNKKNADFFCPYPTKNTDKKGESPPY